MKMHEKINKKYMQKSTKKCVKKSPENM